LNLQKKKLELNNKKNLVHAIVCDISSKNNVDETINSIEKNIGKIDIALLNASAYSPNKNQIFDISNYELLVDVNIKGTLYCVNKLKDVMKNRNNTIAIISSPLGYRGWPTAGAYGISKAAQLSLSESLYFDFKKLNINVRVICPGFIDTEATKKNSFKMPFLKSAEYAGKKIFDRLTKGKEFEIIFPYLIVYFFKFTRILPYKIYFYIWKKLGNF
jgi:NAD(P)-dependent dehydrogenase (short-subunit alcohol dehydrogenase family)